jgi:hypothetical protein
LKCKKCGHDDHEKEEMSHKSSPFELEDLLKDDEEEDLEEGEMYETDEMEDLTMENHSEDKRDEEDSEKDDEYEASIKDSVLAELMELMDESLAEKLKKPPTAMSLEIITAKKPKRK